MTATEQPFPVVLFNIMSTMLPKFQSVDQVVKCDRSNGSYGAGLSCEVVCFTVHRDTN